MARILQVLPLAAADAPDHRRWCAELRERKSELSASRQRVGISRQVAWRQRDTELVVVRTDADDPIASIQALRDSDHPFDRWCAERELALHGLHLADVPAPEQLTEYTNGTVDEFDMFIASGFVVRPGRSDFLRRAVEVSTGTGTGLERVRRWGLKRLTIWMHASTLGDVVIYESVGDIPTMVESMTSDDDPLVADQRRILDDVFGLDLADRSFPIPEAAFSWSDGSGD